jgi:hypothetical protein
VEAPAGWPHRSGGPFQARYLHFIPEKLQLVTFGPGAPAGNRIVQALAAVQQPVDPKETR